MMIKRILSGLLAVILLISVMPIPSHAAGGSQQDAVPLQESEKLSKDTENSENEEAHLENEVLIDEKTGDSYYLKGNGTRGISGASELENQHARNYVTGQLQVRLETILTEGIHDSSVVTPRVPPTNGTERMSSACHTIKANGLSAAGWQCYAYLFGRIPSSSATNTQVLVASGSISGKDTVSKEWFDSIGVKFGAAFRTTVNSSGAYSSDKGHSMILLDYDSNGVTMLEGNTDGALGLFVLRYTWSQFNKRQLSGRSRYICYIIQPSDDLYSSMGWTRTVYSACQHTYTTGHCTKCGALQPLQNENAACNIGVYAAKEKIYLRSDPYETGVGGANNCLISLPEGTEVIVEGAVVNGIGNQWFKVIYGSTRGYIYAPRLVYRRALTSTISASALSVPSNLKVGNSFHISGTITGQYCSITKGRAYFVNASTGVTVSNSATSWVNVNSNSLSLYNHTIDNKLLFGKLSTGTYYYCIEVQTDRVANGQTTHIFRSPNFTVGAASIAAPSITESGAGIGSRTYTISGVGTVYYRLNGGAWTAGSSVTLYTSGQLEAKCVSGSSVSPIKTVNVVIPVLTAPAIRVLIDANGAAVTISAEAGATIMYNVDGGAYRQYTGTFSLLHAASVTAYAQRPGFITSQQESAAVTVSAPNTPTLVRDTAADIAEGTAMAVHWAQDPLASSYSVAVWKDGAQWKTETVSAAQYSFKTNGVGVYEVCVTAANAVGTSAVSSSVSCTAHGPSTVTFQDYDGTVLSEQTVIYGLDATRPATPTRRGYTFSGWSGSYTNVTNNLVIIAEYEINHYSVKFYDVDGITLLTTQEVTFNEAINSELPESMVNVENGGRVFSGWYIVDADDGSERDLAHIDSNMKLRAVTVWGNENLPVYVDNISASLCYDSSNGVFNGYHVSCRVSTADSRDINAKIIVTLLSEVDSSTGVCKMIATKVDTINLTTSSSNRTWTGDILCDGTSGADYIEISVVSVEGSDRTGGLIAETKRYAITSGATQFWSGWMTKEELESHGHSISESTVESKTQYSARTNTKSTITTSSATPPAGYTLLSNNSHWGDWTGWSTTPAYASSTREVQTENRHTGYNMTVYNTKSTGGSRQFRSWSVGGKYSTYGLSSTYGEFHYTMTASVDAVNAAPTVAQGSYTSACTYPGYNKGNGTGYILNNGSALYVFFIESNAYTTYYRYRDWISSYTYYKWDYGNWSDWTDTVLTDSNPSDPSYEVRTRQMYRYVIFDANQITHNTSGRRSGGTPGKHLCIQVPELRSNGIAAGVRRANRARAERRLQLLLQDQGGSQRRDR